MSGIASSSLEQTLSKTFALDGSAGNGAIGTVAVATLTGRVFVLAIFGYCSENFVGATATIALGTTTIPTLFIGATTATELDLGDIWADTTPTTTSEALPAICRWVGITENIIMTVATAAITDGTIEISIYYVPMSSGSGLA